MELTLKQIKEELALLYKQHNSIDKKIQKLVKTREKLTDQKASEYIKKIPEDLNKISDEQWKWILNESGGGMVQHRFCTKIIESFGFSRFGMYPETKQPCIKIYKHKYDANKIKEGFRLLRKHLKPVTVIGYSTETGIRIEVNDLIEDITSVLYVHKEGDVVLYVDLGREPEKFKDFNEFADWYALKKE